MSIVPDSSFINAADADVETREAYENFLAVKTNSYLPWAITFIVVAQIILMFTDYYVSRNYERIYTHILSVILGTYVFWLWLQNTTPRRLQRVMNVWYISCFLATYWLCFLSHKTPAFMATLVSIPFLAICITFLSCYNTQFLLLLFSTSLSLFVAFIVVQYGVEEELLNLSLPILMMILCIMFNRWRNKLYFAEFSLKREFEKTVNTLTATQNQLVYTEKMAALGELTAGIVHDIQNPLNFVNNFSDLSIHAIKELETEWQKPVRDFSLDDRIFTDIKSNLQRISVHGKRISAIVKSMLDHTRTNSQIKHKPVNINNLITEYLQLAYENAKLEDKTLNVKLITKFDAQQGNVNIVPEEISRVLLNLFSNAFYAVREKLKEQSRDYCPQITVSTCINNNCIEIRVADNGTGIPEALKQKIFQPFFTTKAAGEGAGLGLSLSYDIVTKGHKGTFSLETDEGTGTEFTISLPIIIS